MVWEPTDIIMYFSVAYGMVKNTAKWLEETAGVHRVEVPIQFPIREGEEVTAFTDPLQKALQDLGDDIHRLKLVVIDHIASVPAVREPVVECATLVKSFHKNAFVLVDGAHAMGQVEVLNISEMQPVIDAYLSNGHKWLYSPKGSAFLWVNSSVVTDTFPEPTVISSANSIGNTCFSDRYSYVSTRDYTAFISISKALEFRESVLGGSKAIYQYTHGLAMRAKHYLMKLWNVDALAPDSLEDYMINIGLPISDMEVGVAMKEYLLEHHNIYMLVLHDESSQMYYTRLSAQVYLEMSDFVLLGDLVLQYTSRGHQGLEVDTK